MEAAIAVILSGSIPFSGILFRRYLNSNHDHPTYNDDHDQAQCHVPSRLVKYLAFVNFGIGRERFVLQIMMLALHTTNALLLMMILKKILGCRRIHDEHIRICSYVAVVAIFAAHSSRTALLNDVDGDLSLLFLIAVVVGLSGLFMTITANGHFQPSIIPTMLLVAGIILAFVTLFVCGEEGLTSLQSFYPSSPSPHMDSSSSSNNNNNAKYYIYRAAQAPPVLPRSMLSPSLLIASTQHLLRAVMGMFSKGVDVVRNTILLPPTATGTLKMLQSVLNIIKAQLYLPVNVDIGYVQTQREAMGFLWGARFSRSQSLSLCRSGSNSSGTGNSDTDESKVVSTLRCAASVISRLSTDYAPVMELVAVFALVGYIIVRCAQQQLHSLRRRSQLSLVSHINPFGINSIVLVSILCSSNAVFSSNRNSSSKDSEMLVLSRQSYIPSAFMSVCLAVALADAWAAQLHVSKETATAAGGGVLGNDYLLLTGMQGQTTATLVQSLTRIVLRLRPSRTPTVDLTSRPPPTLTTAAAATLDKSATRGYWLVKSLQLLSVSVLMIAADTLYKSFHPDEPRCFFRTTATREMEFFCCPTI